MYSLNPQAISFSRRYETRLRNHLRNRLGMSSRWAEGLGRKAISDGLGTLDLANIHGKALLALIPANSSGPLRDRIVKRARAFFMDAISPIERNRGAAVQNIAQLRHSNEKLRMRTVELTTANQRLKKEVAQRKSAERSLRLSEHKHLALLREARQMQRRLRHLSHQVLLAQEEERKEISRELHDGIVQTLTGINVQLASLKIESGASKKSFSKHITYTQRLVEKSVDIVHQFARDLRPTLLDDLGLIPALQTYIKGFAARTGLRVSFSTFAGVEKLSNDKRTALYRVALAALVNVAQHARANTVSVAIKALPQAVLMEISDDGRSFDAEHMLDSRRNKRLGLISMRERVEMVGGTFHVDSALGHGTTVSAKLPFKRAG